MSLVSCMWLAILRVTKKTKEASPKHFIPFLALLKVQMNGKAFAFRINCLLRPSCPIYSAIFIFRMTRLVLYSTHEKGRLMASCIGTGTLCRREKLGACDSLMTTPKVILDMRIPENVENL